MNAEGNSIYPNPTIQEAVCEIHFLPEKPWSPLTFSHFYDLVKTEFPIIETVPVSMFSFQLQSGNPPNFTHNQLAHQIYRYRPETRAAFIQLAENRIIINFTFR